MYKDNWTQPWPMGLEINPKVHENPRTFFSSSSPILLEPLAHSSSEWSLPREDCITNEILPQTEGSSNHQPHTKDWMFVHYHPQDHIIGDRIEGIKTGSSFKDLASYALVFEIKPKTIDEALINDD